MSWCVHLKDASSQPGLWSAQVVWEECTCCSVCSIKYVVFPILHQSAADLESQKQLRAVSCRPHIPSFQWFFFPLIACILICLCHVFVLSSRCSHHYPYTHHSHHHHHHHHHLHHLPWSQRRYSITLTRPACVCVRVCDPWHSPKALHKPPSSPSVAAMFAGMFLHRWEEPAHMNMNRPTLLTDWSDKRFVSFTLCKWTVTVACWVLPGLNLPAAVTVNRV